MGVSFTLPPVQTFAANYVTKKLNEQYGVDINVEKVSVSVFLNVKLKNVLIKDHHQDTLIHSKRIQTNILGFNQLLEGDLIFGYIKADDLKYYQKTYKGEQESNIIVFVEAFEDDQPSKSNKKFLLTSNTLDVVNGHVRIVNENLNNPVSVNFTKLNAELKDFKIFGPDITTQIVDLSLQDHRGIYIEHLQSPFTYTSTNILLPELVIKTKNGTELNGSLMLSYNKGDLSYFTDKVNIDLNLKDNKIAANDLNYFYPEFGKNKIIDFTVNAKGTLNDFVANNLFLSDGNTLIDGDVVFKNIVDAGEKVFSINGNYRNIITSRASLSEFMPNILGKSLPDMLNNLGEVSLNGPLLVDKNQILVNAPINSSIGGVIADLSLLNYTEPNNTTYKGKITAKSFNVGKFLSIKNLGTISGNINVSGKGFTKNSVNTALNGKINSLYFMGYNYSNIIVNGNLNNPVYKGEIHIDDPNLKSSFSGIVDLSKRINNYDVEAQIDYADLATLNLFKRDTLSIFKGNVKADFSGNNIEQLQGKLNISKTSYQNQRDIYYFDDFNVDAFFDQDNIRNITINSKDIIEGRVVGKYDFAELPKMIENALGSLYTNYSPHKLKKQQFLRFNFGIYNKIIEIFFPDISLGNNTNIRGYINSDNNDFKLSLNAPSIDIAQNRIDKIKFEVDNKNPLYNAYVQIDSIKTKQYKVSDFGLINMKRNDTLFFRTELKGGNKAEDYFNINLFHTIDEKNNSVVGFKKSDIYFKDLLWNVNENDTSDNKVIFEKSLSNFTIDNVILSSQNQKVEVNGVIRQNDYKDVNLKFDNVDLAKITPAIENLDLGGILNGDVSLKQNKNIYKPTSSLSVDGFEINKIKLGDLVLNVEGDESLSHFGLNSYLYNEDDELLSAEGDISIKNKDTFINLDLRLSDFNITPFSPFGGEIISNLRGFVSGRTTVIGNLKNPEINGRLFLESSGLKVDYLNTDYNLEDNAVIDLTESDIIFREITMTDTKFGTKGILNGNIKHQLFSDWILGLNFSSDRLLILDTVDGDDVFYYGTAFINGNASISGPTSGLVITADAKSEKGTSLKIPIGSSKSSGEVSYIEFLSPKDKYNIGKGVIERDLKTTGLEMKFNLEVTPDAEVEIIIDRESEHGMKGRGNGTLLLDINTLGKFNMYGNFIVSSGVYNFKYGGILNKVFNINEGGTVTWSGDPTRANLNIEAIYKSNANPAVLLDNPSFNRKIPVEVQINLRGSLAELERPEFELNFPTISSVMQSEIRYKLGDQDTRERQAYSILATGNFTSEGFGRDMFTGNLMETGSSFINNLFAEEDSKFSVGVDYQARLKDPNLDIQDRNQLGISISSQINEDITINGKLGVPVGGADESVVVGNVEMLFRLNQDRSLNARVFNRENDLNFYLGEGIGYTQGIGISWQVDFDTYKELAGKIFGKKDLIEKSKVSRKDDNYDSEFSEEYLRFIERQRDRQRQRKNDSNRKIDDKNKVPDPLD